MLFIFSSLFHLIYVFLFCFVLLFSFPSSSSTFSVFFFRRSYYYCCWHILSSDFSVWIVTNLGWYIFLWLEFCCACVFACFFVSFLFDSNFHYLLCARVCVCAVQYILRLKSVQSKSSFVWKRIIILSRHSNGGQSVKKKNNRNRQQNTCENINVW